MNKLSFCSIFLLGITPLFGMERQKTSEESAVLSPTALLLSSEMKLGILDSLLKIAPFNDAVKAFKALSLTDTTAVQLLNRLKQGKETIYFLEHLDSLSKELPCTFDLSVETIRLIKPFLHKLVYETYKETIEGIGLLVGLFNACTTNSHTNNVFQSIMPTFKRFKELPLAKLCLGNQFWGFYEPINIVGLEGTIWAKLILNKQWIKKDLCVCALEKDAPSSVIELILNTGVRYDKCHSKFLPPFFLVFHKFLNAENASEEERADLKKILDMLLLAGASLDKGYGFTDSKGVFHYESPLSEALKRKNLEGFSYLCSKGVLPSIDDMESLVIEALVNSKSGAEEILLDLAARLLPDHVNILMATVIKYSTFISIREHMTQEGVLIVKERCRKLLDLVVPFYRREEVNSCPFTLLEFAAAYNNNEVVELLKDHGALAARKEGMLRARQGKYLNIRGVLRSLSNDEDIYKESSSMLLEEVKRSLTEICTSLVEDSFRIELLFSGLDLASRAFKTQEADEFFRLLKKQKEFSFDCPDYGMITSLEDLIKGYFFFYSGSGQQLETLKAKLG